MTANQLHSKLIDAGVDQDEASEIVKSRVEAGTVSEDSGYEEAVDPAVLRAATDAILKAVDPALLKADDDYEEEEEEEEDEDDDDEDDDEDEEAAKSKSSKSKSAEKSMAGDYDVVAIVSKGADQILESVERQNTALAKGYLGLAKGYENIANAHNSTNGRLENLEGKLDSILKALGQPIAPRSVVSGDVAAASSPHDVAKSAQITANAVVAMAHAELRSTDKTDSNRMYELTKAVAELDTGADPATIAANYRIQ